jgi:peptide-methionine (R)-S-oxide reductase
MYMKGLPAFLHLHLLAACHGWVMNLSSHGNGSSSDVSRRAVLSRGASATAAGVAFTTGIPQKVHAANSKSRTHGYEVQKSQDEWKVLLTARQFEILREGGTERPYTSILEGEDRPGTFHCAACGTALFDSKSKFHSGTGWPSFATALKGVEVERLNPVQANFSGAELRCGTCGGHLGDVFTDGWIFQGTPAADSGKRFCIDGSALVFKPQDGTATVIGDQYPDKPARATFM